MALITKISKKKMADVSSISSFTPLPFPTTTSPAPVDEPSYDQTPTKLRTRHPRTKHIVVSPCTTIKSSDSKDETVADTSRKEETVSVSVRKEETVSVTYRKEDIVSVTPADNEGNLLGSKEREKAVQKNTTKQRACRHSRRSASRRQNLDSDSDVSPKKARESVRSCSTMNRSDEEVLCDDKSKQLVISCREEMSISNETQTEGLPTSLSRNLARKEAPKQTKASQESPSFKVRDITDEQKISKCPSENTDDSIQNKEDDLVKRTPASSKTVPNSNTSTSPPTTADVIQENGRRRPDEARLSNKSGSECVDVTPSTPLEPPLECLTDDVVSAYIDAHPYLLQKWIPENVANEDGKQELGAEGGGTPLGDSSSSTSEGGLNRSSKNDSQLISVNYSCASRSSTTPAWLSPNMHSQRKSSGAAKKAECLTEQELFMELIRDISNELDIDTLCHKILVNVGHLTQADRASLFLAQGSRNNRYLVAKLFDVTVDSALEQALFNAEEKDILLPWGVGIVGYVASTKEILNIKDAYKDPRFDASVDRLTGYRTSSVLCMPVCNYEGSVIGVAEIINKKDGTREFTTNDVEVFRRYLTFCGIGIQNAQLFDISMQEYKRNQLLLQLARGLFEEQTSLDRLITKIMTEARDLLKCEKCAVYLIEKVEADEKGSAGSSSPVLAISSSRDMEKDGDVETVEDVEETSIGNVSCLPAPEKVLSKEMKLQPGLQMAFELHPSEGRYIIERRLPGQLTSSALARLACYVADTGRTLNISDVEEWLGTSLEDAGHPIYSVLTIPVYNASKQILGVAQMINKENGLPFNEYDISTFEAFAIFSGLGIQNTQVYEKACRLMARQKVALECLSYHATATQEDTDRLGSASIPEADSMQLYSFDFSDLCLTDDETCMCVIRMFKEFNFLEIFRIPHEVLCRYILSVKKNYRPVKYHNWRHALTVAQTMFAMLKTGKMELFMTELEMLGLLVACLSHDLDHRGTNNSFQTKTDSPLALLYSTSTMEHHHFDQCVMILSQDSNNIFQMLSADEYRRVMRVVEKAILSTDMAMYFKKKHKFIELSDNGEFDWQCQEKKELLCGMMMTACDLSAIAKPWEVQHKVAKLVADEFFEQGDLEKLKLNEQPMAIMDRDKKDELPKMQVGFINAICLPLYKSLSESFPWVKPLYDGCERNREQWELLAEQVEMGLTWIDHETIENPVERNAREVVSKITLNPKTLPASVASPLRNVESRRSFAASSEGGDGGKCRGWLLNLL